MKSTINKVENRSYVGEDFTVRMVDEENRIIEGYGIVFNKESRMLGGWFIERINPSAVEGAFDGVDLRSEFNHDPNFLLGRTSSGTMQFFIDEIGVKYRVNVPRNYYGDALIESVKRGDVKGSSFQFITANGGDSWTKETRDGELIDIREVTQFKMVGEMGPVTEPAYLDTTVAKRSFESWQETQKPPQPPQPTLNTKTLSSIIFEIEATA